jgi:hypothetical protein
MAENKPLSNLQLELLKVFSMELKDEELLEIKDLLARYFSEKAMDLADKVWDSKNWTVEDMEEMAYTKMRTSKQSDQ